MDNIRCSADVVSRCRESVYYYADRIAAWEGVKRITKKDGGDFQAFNRNFSGGAVEYYYYKNAFCVHFLDSAGHYQTDDVDVADTVDKQFSAIADRIARYKAWKEAAEKQLAQAEEAAAFVLTKLDEIISGVNAMDIDKSSTLRYALGALLKSREYF